MAKYRARIRAMEKKITPLHDRILLRPMQAETTTSGVYIPPSLSERSQVMEVIEAGDGCMDDGTQAHIFLKRGDKVLVSKYAGTEVTITGEKLFILKQCDILAKVGESK